MIQNKDIQGLQFCGQTLRERISDDDDHTPFWRVKLRIANFLLRRYGNLEAITENSSGDERPGLTEQEKQDLLSNHPLLQRIETGFPEKLEASREHVAELRKKVWSILTR